MTGVPFAYYGGKWGMARKIVALLPAHRCYIEPFFGSGAVLLAKPPAAHEIVNDLDGALVAFWRCLRDRRDELEEVCALTPHSRAEFNDADLDVDPLDELELARRFFVRASQSFAKTAGRRTGWSVTTARSASVPSTVLNRIGRFAAIAQRMARVSIECCDAAGLIERLATPDTVVYADPPYLHSTRSTRFRPNDGAGAGDYRHEMSDDHHRHLAEVLHATPATVLLSGYPSEMYEDLYSDWWHIDFEVTSYSSNARPGGRQGRTERLWANRDLTAGRLPFTPVDTRAVL